jgi:hypothetical protein
LPNYTIQNLPTTKSQALNSSPSTHKESHTLLPNISPKPSMDPKDNKEEKIDQNPSINTHSPSNKTPAN